MASIANDPNGRRRILFVAPDGSRKTIRLSRCDKKCADSICRHVEDLLSAQIGAKGIQRETAAWLSSIAPVLREKLAAVGLVEQSVRVPTLEEFLTEHLANRNAELKPSTMTVLRQAKRWLLRHLDGDARLDQVTAGDADRCRAALLQGRARATANKWTRYAKEFFTAAKRRGLISANPFEHIRGLAVVGNQARRVIIPQTEVKALLNVIPCPQFRLIVALARYAGFRIPSEALVLRWDDVNWEFNRMVIRAPKTAHHADGGVRVVPIFSELRPFLDAAWDGAKEGDEYVVTRFEVGF